MSNVVQSLMVEMDAQTAKLDAKLAQSGKNIQNFGKTAEGAAAAGGALGNRYGQASIQIAGAAENMARMGKVTGEASKAVINNASQVAFAFGPTGMIVGAIGITALAITELFQRTKREAREAARVAEEEFARIAKSGNLGSAQDRLLEVFHGDTTLRKYDPTAFAKRSTADPRLLGLAELRARRDAYNKFMAGGSGEGVEVFTAEQGKALRELEAAYAKLLPLVKDLAKTEADRTEFSRRLAASQKASAKAQADAADEQRATLANAKDAIDAQSRAWEDGIARQAAAIKARDDAAEESTKTTAKLSDELALELARQTKTLVDDIQLKFQKFLDDAAANGDWALVAKFTAARDQAMALQQTIEDLDAAARELGLDFKDIADAGAGGVDPAKFNLVADAIERSARGAIQLAEAFGLVDANTSKSLQAIAQIAVSLPQLKRASSAGQWSGAGGIIASALPVVGGIATVVDAFLSAGKAAREHAKALQEASRRLVESLQDRIGDFGLTDADSQRRGIAKQQRDELNQMLDILIQHKGIKVGTRDDFFAKDQAGQRQVLTSALAGEKLPWLRTALENAIKQFDLIAEAARKAAEEMEAENQAKRASFDQSLEERRLRLAGDDAAADALALLTQHEQELAAARKEGIYTAEQLAELERIQGEERKKAAAAAQKRREEEDRAKAQAAARRNEDLQSRINAADGESPEERARRREIEKRREIEDAMADGADFATLHLIQLAHAAEDAAAAQAALTQAQRDMEDLDVRLLRAQGKGGEADQLDFTNRQRRELEDAQAAGKDAAYLAKLRAAQADELKQFLQGLADAGGGGTGGIVRAGAGTTVQSVGQALSEGSANRVVSELASIRIHTKQTVDELALLRSMSGAVSGALMPPAIGGTSGGGARAYVTVNLNGPINALDGGKALSATLIKEINRALGQLLRQTSDLNGSAAI